MKNYARYPVQTISQHFKQFPLFFLLSVYSLHQKSGIPYSDMLYFDSAGIYVAYVKSRFGVRGYPITPDVGMNFTDLNEGLQLFHNSKVNKS